MTNSPIEMAADYLQQGGEKPNSQTVVAALAAKEKQSRKEKRHYAYEDLLGSWRLGFVSGTKMVRSKPNARPVKKLGKGRFIPRFVNIEITYKERRDAELNKSSVSGLTRPNVRSNSVKNSVALGPLRLRLYGPTSFEQKLNALAFDFTEVAVDLGSWTAYRKDIRGGEESRQSFETRSLKDQAFFTFFLVEDRYIAARGKGGGLALWTSVKK